MKYIRELVAGNVLYVLEVLGVLYVVQHWNGLLPLVAALFVIGVFVDWAWDTVR